MKTNTPSQSIIIPYHKDKDMLFYSLKTLMDTLPTNIEIIVVGNNYNCKELDFEIEYENCHYLTIPESLLYPQAINIGVEKSKGEIITLCDPDVFYRKNWYIPLLESLLKDDNVGVVCSKLINPISNRILDYGSYLTKFNSISSMQGLRPDHPLAAIDREVQFSCGAILMTKRELFDQLGGLDINLPYAYTEFDYSLRAKQLGYSTMIIAKSEVFHKGRTDSQNSKNTNYSYLKGDCKGIFYGKHYSNLTYDFPQWFAESAQYFNHTYPSMPKKYVLIDMCTSYDKEDYYKLIKDELNIVILDRQNVTIKSRDKNTIALHHYVPFGLIDLVSPILFFVDMFTSLFDNALWFEMRDIRNDLVIDRHGNIVPLLEIAQNKC